jgi:trehalose 6-phosphate phosphatase
MIPASPSAATMDLPPLPADAALFLDVDGTLVELAAAPDAVRIEAKLIDTMAALSQRLDGAVALISGRAVTGLDQLFSPLSLPMSGSHGLERRDAAGRTTRPDPLPDMRTVLARFIEFADFNPGVIVEDKLLSAALHFRKSPSAGKAAIALAEQLLGELDSALMIQLGKMMVEVRPSGADKGSAIAAFMEEAPFSGRIPVFIGDDITDENGFKIINARGGLSVRVGNGGPTIAKYRLADVGAVLQWLKNFSG